MQYQQSEYTIKIRDLLEEKESLNAALRRASQCSNNGTNNFVLVNGGGNNDRAEKSSLKVTYINHNNNDCVDNEKDESTNEIQQFDNSYNDVSDNAFNNKQSFKSSVQVITTKTYAIPYNEDNDDSADELNEQANSKIKTKKTEKSNNKTNDANSIINKEDDSVKQEMKRQIELLENQVKATTEKNNLLIEQYEKNVQYLNDQVKFFKVM